MPIATNPSTGEVVFLNEKGEWSPAQTAVNPDTREMLAYDGRDWKPVPASKGVFGYVDDAVRSLASGVTLGWADEFAAKMDELTGRGKAYDKNLERERAKDTQIPVAIQLPAEIAGAVGSTVLVAPLAAFRAMAAASSRIPQWMRFAGLGAAEGAAAGAGHATEDARGSGAAAGAALGAGVGAIAPTVVRGVSSAVSGVRNAVSPSAGAAADIGRAIVRDETTPQAMAQRVAASQIDRPGEATLADVGGENVRGLVERIAQTPGAGRTQVVPALTARQEGQAGRIADDLRGLTGTSRAASQAIDETIAERAAASRPLYDEAFNFNARESPEIVRAWQNATAQGYGRSILNSASLRRALQTEYGIRDAADAPLMVLIDAWKKTADDLIGEATRKGSNNTARVISRMRDSVVDVVDTHNPAYLSARNAWSGPSRYLDMIEEGRGILSRNVSADEMAANFRRLTAADQEAYRIGAISSIISRMGNDGARLADMTKYLRSPEMRAKISAMMPDDAARQAWQRRLDFEVTSSELTGRALGNSATARRLAEKQDAEGIVGDLVLDVFTAGGPSTWNVLRRVLTAGPRWLRDTVRSRTDRELADVLTNPARVQDLPAVLNRAAAQRRNANAVGTIGSAAAVGGGVVTTQ